jgi:hypothetical protein
MISKVTTSIMSVAAVWLFGFSLLGQEPQSAVKPDESQSAAKPDIIPTMTLDSAQRIIQAMGFEVTRAKDDKGQPGTYLSFKAEGYIVYAQAPVPDFIWLYNIFSDKATPETVNAWNANNRFCRAYSGDKGNVYLETEVIVHGGTTRENIEVQIKKFRDSVARWARYLVDHENKEATALPKQ